jgi:hypothetical protein
VVRADALIGAPFGAVFEPDNRGGLVRVAGDSLALTEHEGAEAGAGAGLDGEDAGSAAMGKDNRNLADTHGAAQGLSAEQVKELKTTGMSGAEIIKQLVANSSTFDGKTVFSQVATRRARARALLCARSRTRTDARPPSPVVRRKST